MAAPAYLDLSERDRRVLEDLRCVRLLSGGQIERLHFAGLVAGARGSARRRSLGRLASLGLVTTLPRRVGGERAGSAGLVYVLDAQGVRWLDQLAAFDTRRRVRRPWAVGWPFVQHTLDVAELYVRLRERERLGQIKLRDFAAEPASWFSSGRGVIKPDAWAIWDEGPWEHHRWLEVDRATESRPTLMRKLRSYVDFAVSGEPGPKGVVPQVLLTVPDRARAAAVRAVIEALPAPGSQLIDVQLFAEALAARPPPP
jgi:hypothetical protein